MSKYHQQRGVCCIAVTGVLLVSACASTTGDFPSKPARADTGIMSSAMATGGTPAFTKFHGDYSLTQLGKLPERYRETPHGIIESARELEAIWPGFNSLDGSKSIMPSVDFSAQVIVFVRNTQFYNRIHLGTVNIIEGKAEIASMETRSALPLIDKAAFAMLVFDRKDVTHLRFGDQWIALP